MNLDPSHSLPHESSGEPKRLSKVVAALVPCSRSEAEQFIAEGRVRVNGRVVDQPQSRVSGEHVEVDARGGLQPATPATFLLNKPGGMPTDEARALLARAAHWPADASGMRWVKSHSAGLVPLLDLPPEAAGLVVFSQDGRIVRKLREDANLLEQELVADVAGAIADRGLSRLRAGLVFGGTALPPVHVSWQSETRLRFAMKGIRPDVVPWMCAQIGLELTALRRIRIGRVSMAGLPSGQWRYLASGERF